MTLRKLLETLDKEKIVNKILECYYYDEETDDNHIRYFTKAIEEMKITNQTASEFESIMMHITWEKREDDSESGLYVSVDGYGVPNDAFDGYDTMLTGLDFVDWSELLDLPIIFSHLKPADLDTAAHIVFEITAHGNSMEDVDDKAKDLGEAYANAFKKLEGKS